MSTEGLTPRAASLLRTLVSMHIREGQPVGSKALHVESGMSVSTATIRNVMSDLEERGLLSSPHTSAGRIPTAQGYRLPVVDPVVTTHSSPSGAQRGRLEPGSAPETRHERQKEERHRRRDARVGHPREP